MKHGFMLLILQTGDTPDPLGSVLRTLATDYDMDMESKITLARCDVAQNDVPVEVYHLPTIKLYPAEKKRAPVEYFGRDDDVNQYKSFIKEEGSKRYQLSDVISTGSWKSEEKTVPSRQGSGLTREV